MPFPRAHEHRDAGYALINYLLDPAVNAKEVWPTAIRWPTAAPTRFCPRSCWRIRSSTRPRSSWTRLEFGAAATLTDPNRAELLARFKSA